MGGFFALGPVICSWALVGLCHEGGVFSGNIAVHEFLAAVGLILRLRSLVSFLRFIIWFWRLLYSSHWWPYG